jgi:Transglycosylase-like domain
MLLAALAALALTFALLGASDSIAASSGGLGPGSPDPAAEGSADRSATPGKYERLWVKRITLAEKRWARRTAECESGGDPDAIGGGGMYRGAFQFMRQTWKRSPQSPGGDPIAYSYKTQAVVAVMLKRQDGAGHWPNCG